MPVYVRSTFSRDDAESLEYADTGEVWEYFGSAPFGMRNQGAALVIARNRAVAALECSSADGWLQAAYTGFAGGAIEIHALAFRIQDIDNYWFIANLTSAGAKDNTKLSLWKRVGGVNTNVGGHVTYTWQTTDDAWNIGVRLSGSSIAVYLEGSTTAALSVSDSALATATKHGLSAMSDSNNRWDNWLFHSFPFTASDVPVLQLEVAFRRDNADNPMYMDLSNRMFGSFSTRRGRPDELSAFEPGSISGLQLRNDDRALEPEYEGDVVNLVRNPSVETGTTSWSGDAASISRLEVARHSGSWGLRVTTTNATASGARYTSDVNQITAGQTYTASAYVKLAAAGSKTLRVKHRWRDAALAVLSTTSGGNATVTDTAWTRLQWTATAPVNTVRSDVQIETDSAQGVFDFYVDDVQLENASAATDYIDGSLPNGHWSGTAHASWSHRGAPLFPYILPRRALRLKLFGFEDWGDPILAGTVFDGMIDSWPQKWLLKKVQITTPTVSDKLKRVSLSTYSAVRGAELISDRLDQILTDVTLDIDTNVNIDNTRSIATTTRNAQAKTYSHENRLSAAREMETTEHGRLFANRFGVIIFLKHADELASPYTVSQVTFGDGGSAAPTELPYADPFEWTDDERYIYNAITYTRNGGTEQTVTDTTSQGTFGYRALQRSTLGNADADSLALATLELARHKDPTIRGTITLKPHRDARLWAEIKERELCDRVTVKRRPEAGGVWSQDFQVLNMELRFRIGGPGHLDCEATYALGPVFTV